MSGQFENCVNIGVGVKPGAAIEGEKKKKIW